MSAENVESAAFNFVNYLRQEIEKYIRDKFVLNDEEILFLQKYGFVSYTTDEEGKVVKHDLQILRNSIFIEAIKKKYPALKDAKTTTAFGGDLTDHAQGNIAILLDAQQRREKGSLITLNGNREFTKARGLEALSPALIEQFSTLTKPYGYWPGAGFVSTTWVNDAIKEKGFIAENFYANTWSTLTRSQKQLAILQASMEKTQGSGKYLKDLKADFEARLNRQLTDPEWVSIYYELHFSRADYQAIVKAKWIEQRAPVLSNPYAGLQDDYVRNSVLGFIFADKTLFMHSLNQVFPRMQDGSEFTLSFWQKHQVKGLILSALTILAFIPVIGWAGILSLTTGAAVTLVTLLLAAYLFNLAYIISNKGFFQYWLDARQAEVMQSRDAYIKEGIANPDALFDFNAQNILKPHPFIDAGLPKSAQRPHVVVSTNSAAEPITEKFAQDCLQKEGIALYVAGHQICAPVPLIKKPTAGLTTVEADTGANSMGGGVIIGARFLSGEVLEQDSNAKGSTIVVGKDTYTVQENPHSPSHLFHVTDSNSKFSSDLQGNMTDVRVAEDTKNAFERRVGPVTLFSSSEDGTKFIILDTKQQPAYITKGYGCFWKPEKPASPFSTAPVQTTIPTEPVETITVPTEPEDILTIYKPVALTM